MGLIKLQIKKQVAKGNSAEEITNRFIEACIKLDASIFEPLIEEDKYFDYISKYDFLASLKKQFDFAKSKGFDSTIVKSGSCGICVLNHETLEFFGADGTIRFAYIIEQKDGEIKDIYNCNASSGWFKK